MRKITLKCTVEIIFLPGITNSDTYRVQEVNSNEYGLCFGVVWIAVHWRAHALP